MVMVVRLGEMSMDGWGRDVRTAIRGFLRQPGFTAVAVLTLALGIGANTAMFSVVDGVVLEPLAYPEPEELVTVSSAFPTMGFEDFWLSPPEYFELGERARSLEEVGAYRPVLRTVGGGERPQRIQAAIATRTLFSALGVDAALGRVFAPEEDRPGGPPAVVLSWGLWTRSFGGDRGILGRAVPVNGEPHRVVGVMPRGFDLADQGIELWIPAALDPSDRSDRAAHFLEVVGRLTDGADPASATRELDALVARWEEDSGGAAHVPSPEIHPLDLEPLRDEVVGEVRPALLVLLGAVGFVLLIACANVANLLLVRAEDRHREVSVRVALGAGRGRLLRQFLVEGTVLSAFGAAAGLALAWLCLEAVRLAGPPDIPRLGEVELDATVLLVTTAVTVAVGVGFGLAPARSALGRSPADRLRGDGLRTTDTSSRRGFRALLVAGEIALALVLAIGAGLMLRSFDALSRVEPGFEPDGLLTFQTYLPQGDYPGSPETSAFLRQLLDELEAAPGVEAASASSGLPTRQSLAANDIQLQGLERSPDGPPHNVDYLNAVTTGYRETLGIPLLEGRGFAPSDGPEAEPVALVNQAFAERFFPGSTPLGRLVRACCDEGPWYRVVGVVDDVKQEGLESEPGTEIFFHEPQVGGRTWSVALRVGGEPASVGGAVREAMGRLDPSLPVARLQPMEAVLGEAVARNRFLTGLMAAFAGLALLLAAVGTYGVMSYSVSRRAREVGIRVAMGAPPRSVLSLVLTEGLRVTAAGLVLGGLGAWSLTGVLDSLLFGVEARDPVSFAAGPLLLAAVALAACWIPARRATRNDPVQVLRAE
jgi:putative ABC transport system permease protein